MTADRHQFVGGSAVLGQAAHPGLFQPMQTAPVGQSRRLRPAEKSLPSPNLERGLPAAVMMKVRCVRGIASSAACRSGVTGMSTSSEPLIRSMRMRPFETCDGQANDLGAAGNGFERELEHQPLLRSARPKGAIGGNLAVGPRMIAPWLFGSFGAVTPIVGSFLA